VGSACSRGINNFCNDQSECCGGTCASGPNGKLCVE
jgi:hypothetical protein